MVSPHRIRFLEKKEGKVFMTLDSSFAISNSSSVFWRSDPPALLPIEIRFSGGVKKATMRAPKPTVVAPISLRRIARSHLLHMCRHATYRPPFHVHCSIRTLPAQERVSVDRGSFLICNLPVTAPKRTLGNVAVTVAGIRFKRLKYLGEFSE